MKVGIITFHWATNYGAVLQAYALQEAIRTLGHEVEIINYKPYKYEDNLWTFLRYRKFLNYSRYSINRNKEKELVAFRHKYLKQTKKFGSQKELKRACFDYDVLITGSDQVLNQSFLKFGEPKGSTAYFLDFGNYNIKRLAYAASFGSTEYPLALCKEVEPLIKGFHSVSTRENTGLNIFLKMGATEPVVVCDPTLLHRHDLYDNIIIKSERAKSEVRAYMLRGRELKLNNTLHNINALLIKADSLSSWLYGIKNSSHFVTNSYHGLVFCLLYHVPFSVVLEKKENIGMNDRFYTLLSPLNLTDRIFTEDEFVPANIKFDKDWNTIDLELEALRKTGWDFLINNI